MCFPRMCEGLDRKRAVIYADDILIGDRDGADHDKYLKELLEIFAKIVEDLLLVVDLDAWRMVLELL